MSFRSRKLLRAANDRPCVLCQGRGTTIAAHSMRIEHGHGTGIKAPDYYVAFVCQTCHDLMDGRTGRLTKDEKSELWLRAFVRTVAVWFDEGLVTVA